MIHVVTWLWGDKYPPFYVERLQNALARHMAAGYRFLVAKPEPEDEYLTALPGCLCRLRTFSPTWQADNGISPGDRIVIVDLDMVITRSLAGLFDRPEPFCILQGVNTSNPGLFNGSLWLLTAGYRPDVWADFSLERISSLPYYAFPSDQGWLEHMIPDAGAFGPGTGVYGFGKRGWPPGPALPANARMVAFFGWRDPSKFTYIPWVQQNWR